MQCIEIVKLNSQIFCGGKTYAQLKIFSETMKFFSIGIDSMHFLWQ